MSTIAKPVTSPVSGELRRTIDWRGAFWVASGVPALVLPPGAAATVGLLLYAVAFALVRPAGLLGSWRYLRSLA